MAERPTVTTTEAGKRLNVTIQRVRQFISEGRLKAERLGRDWFIYESSLKAFRPLPRGPKPKK